MRNMEQALERNPLPPAYLPAFYATALVELGRLAEARQEAAVLAARRPNMTAVAFAHVFADSATAVRARRVAAARAAGMP